MAQVVGHKPTQRRQALRFGRATERWRFAGLRQEKVKVSGLDFARRAEHLRPHHQVLKLTDIARPIVGAEALQGSGGKVLDRQPLLIRITVHKVTHQIGNIRLALAQRWQVQRHNIEAVEEVLPECAFLNLLFKRFIGCGKDTDIDLNFAATPDARQTTVLQHTQQARLRIKRHIANLI